jgi:transposase
VNGNTKQSDIAKAFGIPLVTVNRAVKLYRQEGPKGFYAQRKTRGAAVLTAPVLAEAQELLDEGLEPSAVAERLSIKPDTLSKAVRAGRLRQRAKKKTFSPS